MGNQASHVFPPQLLLSLVFHHDTSAHTLLPCFFLFPEGLHLTSPNPFKSLSVRFSLDLHILFSFIANGNSKTHRSLCYIRNTPGFTRSGKNCMFFISELMGLKRILLSCVRLGAGVRGSLRRDRCQIQCFQHLDQNHQEVSELIPQKSLTCLLKPSLPFSARQIALDSPH